MRRYIVGLLATVGTLRCCVDRGRRRFLRHRARFARNPCRSSMVLSLDLRRLPPESRVDRSAGGGLLRDSRDLIDTVQLLWQAADDPRVVGLYRRDRRRDGRAGACPGAAPGDRPLPRQGQVRDRLRRIAGRRRHHFADYYLASALEQIWLQPSGGFAVTGIAVETPVPARRARQARHHRSRAASASNTRARPTPSLETGYTRPARENLQQLLDSLFGQFVADVARERTISSPRKLRQLINSAPFDAERARQEGLVDKLGYRADAIDEVWQARRHDPRSGRRSTTMPTTTRGPSHSGDVIALVRVSGPIISGPATRRPRSTTTPWPPPKTWSTRSSRRRKPRK